MDTFRIAWQSALAAGISLGLPAGFVFWLAILQHIKPIPIVEKFSFILLQNESSDLIGALLGACLWGIFLSRISGYHRWWFLIVASMLGIYLGRRLFWTVYIWLDYDFSDMPVPLSFAIHLIGQILSVTFCTGLSHGMVLRNWRAILTLAFVTSFISVLTAIVIYAALDQMGLHVGTGNFAMPKVTAVCTLLSAMLGGMALGVGFTWFLGEHPAGASQLSG